MKDDTRYVIDGMRLEIRRLQRELWIRSEAIRRLSGLSCRAATQPERDRISIEGFPRDLADDDE